jgi:hypothetical protein
MLLLFSVVQLLLAALLAVGTYAYAHGLGVRSPEQWIKPYEGRALQNIVRRFCSPKNE